MAEQQRDEIMAYNDILELISRQYKEEQDPEWLWTFKKIKAHQGPLMSNSPHYKGSSYNVLVQWEDGSSTYEPLDIIAKDDPVTCAGYALMNHSMLPSEE